MKRSRLLATGLKLAQIEERYNISRRIQAEEDTLGTADLIITSTSQEIEEQYDLYDHYQPEQMRVISRRVPIWTTFSRRTAPRPKAG